MPDTIQFAGTMPSAWHDNERHLGEGGRQENRGGRVLFSSAFGCNDIWSRKWGRLNFGVLWCKHHLKFHKDHSRSFLGGAADFCICSYEVVLYLQPDVKPDSWTTIDVSHTRFVAANHEHINLTGSLGFWIRDDFPTKTPARFFTGFLEGNIHRNSGGHRWFRGPPARFERHFLKLKIEVARWVFQLPLADDENDVHEIYNIFSLTYIYSIYIYVFTRFNVYIYIHVDIIYLYVIYTIISIYMYIYMYIYICIYCMYLYRYLCEQFHLMSPQSFYLSRVLEWPRSISTWWYIFKFTIWLRPSNGRSSKQMASVHKMLRLESIHRCTYI